MIGYKIIEDFTLSDCLKYLKEHSSSPLVEQVRERMNILYKSLKREDDVFFAKCLTIDDFQEYLRLYQESATDYCGMHCDEAKRKIEDLYFMEKKDSKEGCESYLEKYPNGVHTQEARMLIDRFNQQSKMGIIIGLIIVGVIVFVLFLIVIKGNNTQNYNTENHGSNHQNSEQTSSVNYKDTSTSRYVVINGTDLMLRYEPSANSATFKWKDGSNRHPKRGESFKYLGESGDYYKIDFYGNNLWVTKKYSYLSDNSEDGLIINNSSIEVNSNARYVVINGTELRLRYGPSTSYDTFKWKDGSNRHPKKGSKYRYLGEQDDFYKIDFEGHELWVSKQFSYIE